MRSCRVAPDRKKTHKQTVVWAAGTELLLRYLDDAIVTLLENKPSVSA